MKHVRLGFYLISKQIASLAIVLLILLIILAGALYWLSEAVEQRQDEIAEWASDELGYPITIGSASLKWKSTLPKLYVSQFTLSSKNAATELLSVKELYLGIDILSTLTD